MVLSHPLSAWRWARTVKLSLIGFLVLAGALAGESLYYGMPQEEVFELLGQPTSSVRMGEREILQFGPEIRVEFEEGKVSKADGVELLWTSREVEKRTAETLDETDVTESVADAVGEVESTDEAITEASEAADAGMEEDADWNEEDWGDENYDEQEAYEESWLATLVGLLIQFTVCFIVIRMGFGMKGMPCVYPQILAISGVYVAIWLILDLIPWGLEVRDMLYVDDIIAFAGLTGSIFWLSDVKSGLTAIKISLATILAAKILIFVVVALGLFALMALM